jgi:hypothetical protein
MRSLPSQRQERAGLALVGEAKLGREISQSCTSSRLSAPASQLHAYCFWHGRRLLPVSL